MNPTLRILWLAFGPIGIVMLVFLCLMILGLGVPGTRRQFSGAIIYLLMIGTFLGTRFAQFSKAGVWRWLPDGQKTLKRARNMAVIAGLLALGVVFGKALWLGILEFRSGPIPRWLPFLIVGVTIVVTAHRLWATHSMVLPGTSPAARILQSNRLWIYLPAAMAATFYVPYVFHDFLRIHARDTYAALAGGAAGFAAVAITLIGMTTARRARLLWMLCGNSRAEVMKTCERSLVTVLALLVVFAWLAPTVTSLIYAPSFDWKRSAWLLPVLFVAAIGPMYLGFALPTFASWWRNAPRGHILLLVLLVFPLVWRAAYAIVQPLERIPLPLPVLYGAVAAIALRAFALWRWRKIDWTYMKPDLFETRP